jgi:hypothetical protein
MWVGELNKGDIMKYKILESNGVEIENIDGGAFNNFCADGKSGIISEVLDECKIVAQGNVITVGSGELLIKGVRVKIEESTDFTLSGSPAVETHYYIVSKIVLNSDGSILFDIFLTISYNILSYIFIDCNRL